MYVPNEKPTFPGSNKDGDPWLHRLLGNRTATAKFKDAGETSTTTDSWEHVGGADALHGW